MIEEVGPFSLMHALGSFGLGALAVVPRRHVVRTADLDESEVAHLGGALRQAARIVEALIEPSPVQVYTCQWSHHGGRAAHLHYILQPIQAQDLTDHPGLLGPELQSAICSSNAPDATAVAEFTARARALFRFLRSGTPNPRWVSCGTTWTAASNPRPPARRRPRCRRSKSVNWLAHRDGAEPSLVSLSARTPITRDHAKVAQRRAATLRMITHESSPS